MPVYFFHWSDEIVEHLADNDVSPDEFEEVVQDAMSTATTSRSTGRPARIGVTKAEGRVLFCVFEWADADRTQIEPIIAYEID